MTPPINPLASPTLTLPNKYRIGDSIAVMLLCALINERCGEKHWRLTHPNYMTQTIIPRYMGMQWEPGTDVPEHVFDDVNLWIWNDIFLRIGHRVDWQPVTDRMPKHRVVFAPLFEADYAAERAMHPHFVRDLAMMLAKEYGDTAVILLPERISYHDFELLRTVPLAKMYVSLPEAIEIIGNCDLFIGGDTGLSHIAGCFPLVQQIALHDRQNTERHVERKYDHACEHRGEILAVADVLGLGVTDCEYRSFPNKASAACRLFDHGGADGRTLDWVMAEAARLLRVKEVMV